MALVSNKYIIERKYIKHGNARPGTKLTGGKPSFFVAHETANNSADAYDHFNYFNNNQPSASAHTFIDDNHILEIIPLFEKAYHVQYNKPTDNKMFGDDANDDAIGTELCRTGNFKKAYDRYVWYHAYLCINFGRAPKYIVAHKVLDPERRSDPQSWLGPNGISWEKFIKDVTIYYEAWTKETVVVKVPRVIKPIVISNPEKALRFGDRGPAVKELQNKLISVGFKLPKYGADSDYGKETVEAVKAFQKKVGIEQDGLYGPTTDRKLDSYKVQNKDISTMIKFPGKAFQLSRPYMEGKDVERIQRAVGIPESLVDGVYGPRTANFVTAYQDKHGLSVDGIVGKDTWNKMF